MTSPLIASMFPPLGSMGKSMPLGHPSTVGNQETRPTAPTCAERDHNWSLCTSTDRWLNQPIWKICSSKWVKTSSPNFRGENVQNIWVATTWLKCESWPGRIPEVLSHSFWYLPQLPKLHYYYLLPEVAPVLPRGLWWSRKVTFLGGNASIYFPYSHVPKPEKRAGKHKKKKTGWFCLKRIQCVCCSYGARQRWKARLPLKMFPKPTRQGIVFQSPFFRGELLNFRGVRLYGMQPKNPSQHVSGEGVFVILGGGSHP